MAIFKLSHSFNSKIITRATLHIFVRPPPSFSVDEAAPVRVNIYERYPNGTVSRKFKAFLK